jgi:dTDP-4-amino-4,6-dideoxygalactose transaminase
MTAITLPPAPTTSEKTHRAVPVPFLDLKAQYQPLREEVLFALRDVADSTAFVLGPKVTAFEEAFAHYTGVKHCVAVNSGTSALHLALLGADVGPGDEVITVPMTFIATSWAISYCGARPVFVDVDRLTCTMDVREVVRCITPRTKAILPVHLYGQPADLEPLLDIARQKGIALIEDAAQAHGAQYRGRPIGSWGVSGCFSFYPGKNLGAYGEGGAVVTNDDGLARRFRALRDHAQAQRYHHEEIGFNYRMDAFQGAVLNIKLKHIEAWTERRRALAERYRVLLADLPLELPAEGPSCRHVWHLFVVRHPERDRLRTALENDAIQTGLHYPVPLHLQKAYANLNYSEGSFPVAEQIGRHCLSLPLFPEMSHAQQDAVVASLCRALS